MLPPKIFENLHTAVTIFVLFKQILSNFFGPKYGDFTKYDAFCLHIFDYACLGRKACCYRRGSKLWKNCFHHLKTCLKMGGGRMHPSHPPLPAMITMSFTTGFSNYGIVWHNME